MKRAWWAWFVWWPTGIGVGLFAERVAFGFRDPGQWFPDLVAGWTLIGGGLVAWRGRPESRVGLLLVASGFAWFLGNFASVSTAWIAWVAAHGVYLHRGPLVHAVVTFPMGRAATRLERAAVAVGYVAALVTPVWRNESVTVGLAVLLVIVAARRYMTAVAGERRARRTAMWVAVAVGAVLAGGAFARLAWPGDTAEDASLLAYQVVLCLSAVVLAGGLSSRPWEQVAVTDLVVELGEARSDALRDSLARALGDPTLVVGYWVSEAAGFVDATGRPLSLPSAGDGRAWTVVEGGSGPIAVLVHHAALLDTPALVESIGAATRLASVNARLQAEVQAQIAELEGSRRRIVTAGDEEHRRLEARLRAGAERRLEQLAARLSAARAAADNGRAAELLAGIKGQLATTLDELRSLAAGLHPRLLTESGLAGALPALAARCPTPVQLMASEERLPAAIEAAVYFVCSEALTNVAKHAAATQASAAVHIGDGRVVVEVCDNGVGGADPSAGTGLRNLVDRVEALGGTLVVTTDGGTRLVAELPLGDEDH
jgi:signal transduction histidine kinase